MIKCNKQLILTTSLVFALVFGGCSGGSTSAVTSEVDSAVNSGSGISSSASSSSSSSASSGSILGFDGNDSYDYNNNMKGDSYDEPEYTEDTVDNTGDEGNNNNDTDSSNTTDSDDNAEVLAEEKLVYRSNIEIETLDYEKAYLSLMSLVDDYDGRVESEQFSDNSSSYIYYDYSYSYNESKPYKLGQSNTIVLRIPSKNYKQFIKEKDSLGNVTSFNSSLENITQQYYEKQAEVDAYETQLERLQELLNQAETVSDMASLTSQITQIESQLNYMKNDLRTMDMDVAYSYVTLTLKEVVEYTEYEDQVKKNTFIDRLQNTCKDSWKYFLVFCENLLFAIISLLPFIVVAFIILRLFFWKKFMQWRSNRKVAKERRKQMNNMLNFDPNTYNTEESEVINNENTSNNDDNQVEEHNEK